MDIFFSSISFYNESKSLKCISSEIYKHLLFNIFISSIDSTFINFIFPFSINSFGVVPLVITLQISPNFFYIICNYFYTINI